MYAFELCATFCVSYYLFNDFEYIEGRFNAINPKNVYSLAMFLIIFGFGVFYINSMAKSNI